MGHLAVPIDQGRFRQMLEAARRGTDADLAAFATLCIVFSELAREELARRIRTPAAAPGVTTNLLSPREVAIRLRCSEWLVYERIRRGTLRAVRDGRLRIEEAEVERYIRLFRR